MVRIFKAEPIEVVGVCKLGLLRPSRFKLKLLTSSRLLKLKLLTSSRLLKLRLLTSSRLLKLKLLTSTRLLKLRLLRSSTFSRLFFVVFRRQNPI